MMRHYWIWALYGFSIGFGPIKTKFAQKVLHVFKMHYARALKMRRQQIYKHNQCAVWNSNQHCPKKVTINLH